jgi:hypothetical protein
VQEIYPRRRAALTAAILLAAAGFLTADTGARGRESHRTFDDEKAGTAPAGFTFESIRQSDPGRWVIRRDAGTGFLSHEPAQSTGYALAISTHTTPPDVTVSAKLRLPGGTRTGGLVWRYIDDQHYYSLVLDLHGGTIALYRVSGGNHIKLDSEKDLDLDPQAWHTLKVVHTGHSLRAHLGGISVFDDEDRRPRPAEMPVRAGLIAAGNAEVHFDDLLVAETPRKGDRR